MLYRNIHIYLNIKYQLILCMLHQLYHMVCFQLIFEMNYLILLPKDIYNFLEMNNSLHQMSILKMFKFKSLHC